MTENEREAAKKIAWKHSIFAKGSKFLSDLRRSSTVRDIYNEGFDAGFSAGQSQWVKISSADDLPKESGEYLWQRKVPNHFGHRFFSDNIDVDDLDSQWWLSEYVAWQPIQPYTDSDKGE